MFRISALILIIFLSIKTLHAQQQVMFTQYMFNGLVINPAYAGSHESISATVLSRVQWVGIDGAPNTQTFSIHSPVPNKNFAIGGFFVRDNIGITTDNNVFLSAAYRVQIKSGTLSMGMHGGFSNIRTSYADLQINDSNLLGSESTFQPNFGAGLYYVSDRFYAGASSPYLFKKILSNKSSDFELAVDQVQHFYITTGMIFDLSPLIKLKPSLLVKAVSGAPIEIDINANLILDDRVWIGVSYRSFDSIDLLFELQLNNQLRLGYAYDITTSDLRKVNSGSHEIMLNYRFVFSKNKIVTPRYF